MANWRSVITWRKYEERQGEASKKAMRLLIERGMPIMASTTVNPSLLEEALRAGKDYEPSPQTVIFSIHLFYKSF